MNQSQPVIHSYVSLVGQTVSAHCETSYCNSQVYISFAGYQHNVNDAELPKSLASGDA